MHPLHAYSSQKLLPAPIRYCSLEDKAAALENRRKEETQGVLGALKTSATMGIFSTLELPLDCFICTRKTLRSQGWMKSGLLV